MRGKYPCHFDTGRLVIVHLIPFSAFSPDGTVDVTLLKTKHLDPRSDGVGHYTQFNVDGFCALEGNGAHISNGYAQFFRTGAAEIVATQHTIEKGVVLDAVEDQIIHSIEKFVPVLVELGAALPMAVVITLLGFHDTTLHNPRRHSSTLAPRALVDTEVVLPDLVVPDAASSLRDVLRPTLDALSQAYGRERSPGGYPAWAQHNAHAASFTSAT